MILVTGATGGTGRPLTAALVARGMAVRGLTRDPRRAAACLPPGVEIVEGDLDRPESLVRAMQGVERMYLLAAASPRMVEQERNAVEAAVRAGVRHVVKQSAFGASCGAPMQITRWHAEGEERLRRSGLSWTILQPTMFMQNFLLFGPMVAATGEVGVPALKGRAALIDCRDAAAAAAGVLAGAGHEGRTYVLTGPAGLTLAGVIDGIGAAIGRPVRLADTPPAALRQALQEMGFPAWMAADAMAHVEWFFGASPAAEATGDVARLAGTPPRPFEQFAREHAATFSGQTVPAGA